MAQTDDDRPNGLGVRLRALRRRADLTGAALADRLGWVQSKVSRIETGHRMPTEDDIRTWVRATGGGDDLADELVAELPDARAAISTWRQRLKGQALAGIQLDYAELDRDAKVIRGVEVAVVPGLLQTPDYTRHRFLDNRRYYDLHDDAIDDAVVNRSRRQALLYEPGRRFEFVLTEAVLRTFSCPVEVMLGQLDRLLTATTLSNVTIGILPLGIRLGTVPLLGFGMWDDVAVIETYDTEIVLRSDDAAIYSQAFAALSESARTGVQARHLISQAAADLVQPDL